MAPELEARIAKTPARVKAGLWFSIPGDIVLSASEIIRLSDADRMAVRNSSRKRLATLARSLTSRLRVEFPGVTVASFSPGLEGQAPYLAVEASPDELSRIGRLDGVVELTLDVPPDEEEGQSEAWYDLDRIPDLITNGGLDGTGITIIDVLGENGVFDSTDLGLKSGSCQTVLGGPSYACYCPAASTHSPGVNGHMQDALGMIKNTHASLRGGAAKGATTVVGNASVTYC